MTNNITNYQKFVKRGILIVFIFNLLYLPFLIQASSPLEVVINEIAWMGTKVEGVDSKDWWRYEWLELYNNTEKPIPLDGWKIELERADLEWTIKLKGIIPGQDYFLIVASDKIFPYYNFNYSNLNGKLNNKGQRILLKDNLDNIIDEVNSYSLKKWFAGNNETKQTMERKSTKVAGSISSNWQTSQNPGGTPRAKNSEQVLQIQEFKVQKKLAAVGEQLPKTSKPLYLFLIALIIAICSGILILFLKKKFKKIYERT